MKKIVLLLLSVVLIASAFAGVMTVSAATRVEPFLLLEGEDLLPNRDRYTVSWGVSNCSGELDENGNARLLAHGRDPYYHLLPKDTEVRPIMAIKYRADIPSGADGKIYSSAVGGVREGHSFDLGYYCNNEWQLLVVDMALMLPNGVYNNTRHILEHLRFDFLDDGAAEGLAFEVEYIAFFETEDDAYAYDVQRYLPEEETTTVVCAPEPETTVAVEEITTAVTDEETSTEPLTEQDSETEVASAEESEREPTEQTSTSETDAPPASSGCKAVLATPLALSVAVLAVGACLGKKKQDK